LISIFGKPRSKIGRLNAEVQKGANTIKVESGLDWVAGDKLGLAANTMRHDQVDYAIVSAYDSATGIVTLDRTLNYYHWGAATSTADAYSGVDMRGEVLLLSRSI
jgi:hypothetical protein